MTTTITDATPQDDEAFWTPSALDHFLNVWQRQSLPEIDCCDADGANLWVRLAKVGDIDVLAERLELPLEVFGATIGVEFARGYYEVRIVEAAR